METPRCRLQISNDRTPVSRTRNSPKTNDKYMDSNKHSASDQERRLDESLREHSREHTQDGLDPQDKAAPSDLSKIQRSLNDEGQKMDSVHPDDLRLTRNDRIIEEGRDDEKPSY